MKNLPVNVGLDYSNSGVQVCVLDEQGAMLCNRKVPDHWEAIRQVADQLGPVRVAVIEACTGSADLADELIGKAGWPVEMALPSVVRRMKSGPDKTDWGDARVLADLGRVNYVPRVWLAPQPVRELRLVVRLRQQLVDERRACKLRVGALLRQQRIVPAGRRWSQRWVGGLVQLKEFSEQGRWVVTQHVRKLLWLEQQIGGVEQHLAGLARTDWMVQALMTHKGVGLVTACVMRAEIGSFTRFATGKRLSRYCALTPCNASSGLRQADAGVVKAGNALLRRTLVEAAHRLARFDPHFRQLALRLRAAGKPGGVVAVAVANRWIRRIYHDLKLKEAAA